MAAPESRELKEKTKTSEKGVLQKKNRNVESHRPSMMLTLDVFFCPIFLVSLDLLQQQQNSFWCIGGTFKAPSVALTAYLSAACQLSFRRIPFEQASLPQVRV